MIAHYGLLYGLLWTIMDYFKPEKIGIETKTNAINNMKVHNIKYENGGFYLTINNLRGYFNFNNNHSILTMLFDDINKQNKYYQVWTDIFGVINRGKGELKLHEKVVLHDGDFPIKQVFKIHSITIVIKSLLKILFRTFIKSLLV